MNNIVQYTNNPAAYGTLAAVGVAAAMAAGQPVWPIPETPVYVVPELTGSYSPFIDQALTLPQPSATDNFVKEIADIYSALAESQEPLGSEFEAVWDSNVESLYES